MKWKLPPMIKIYEAMCAMADGRVEVDSHSGKVFSSTGNKYYEVVYDPAKKAIMANDNGSYWQGYLGYPSVAFLMKTSILDYEEKSRPGHCGCVHHCFVSASYCSLLPDPKDKAIDRPGIGIW